MSKFIAKIVSGFKGREAHLSVELVSVIKNYLFYSGTTFLRLAIFYYIAACYGKSVFVSYNLYLAYSEIAMTAACVGTATIFIIKDNIAYKLSSAILFENIGIAISFIVVWLLLKYKLLAGGDGLSMPLLALLILGRTNNQIFARYYNFVKSKMALSTLIDVIGSYSWVVVALVIALFHHIERLDSFIYLWLIALLVSNTINFYYERHAFNFKASVENLRYFFITSIKSANFSLVGILFTNIEKIIIVHKFIGLNIAIISSYLALSKVLGFFSDLTTGFMGKLLGSKLSQLDAKGFKDNGFLWGVLAINSVVFIIVSLIAYLCKDWIYYLLKNQIAMTYISLLLYLIPVCVFNNIRSLITFYFQRHKKFAYLNVVAFFQIGLLLLLFSLPLSIFQFVLFEAAYLAILFSCDILYLWHLHKKELSLNLLVDLPHRSTY